MGAAKVACCCVCSLLLRLPVSCARVVLSLSFALQAASPDALPFPCLQSWTPRSERKCVHLAPDCGCSGLRSRMLSNEGRVAEPRRGCLTSASRGVCFGHARTQDRVRSHVHAHSCLWPDGPLSGVETHRHTGLPLPAMGGQPDNGTQLNLLSASFSSVFMLLEVLQSTLRKCAAACLSVQSWSKFYGAALGLRALSQIALALVRSA